MEATKPTTLDFCELDIIQDTETLRAVIGLLELKSYVPTPLSTRDSGTDENMTDHARTSPSPR